MPFSAWIMLFISLSIYMGGIFYSISKIKRAKDYWEKEDK